MDLERDLIPQMGFRPAVSEDLKTMAADLFRAEALPGTFFPAFAK